MAITITEEMLQKADSYLNISVKTALAEKFAIACVENNGKKSMSGKLPPLVTERYGLKQQYLMGVLAQLYLHQSFTKQKFEMDDGKKKTTGVLDCCMDEESYDEWASSHVFSQINRFIRKRDCPVSDKAYEMLNDFKTFAIMLDKSIKDLVDRNNDVADRLARALNIEMTPETVKQLFDELKAVQELAEEMKRRKGEK